MPFLLLELVLRWCGVGHETRLVVRAPDAAAPTVFQFNPYADRAYYGVEDLSGPDPRPFQLPKPAGTYRIVVVGGSTVAGFPYPFELAMPKQLELVLNEQLPERRFEVLNAGITAINSLVEVDIMRQVIACQPDLIVVHSGHNEFYGLGGSASNFSRVRLRLISAMRPLRRQRLFQFVFSLVHRPKGTHLLETLPADIGIALDSPLFRDTRQRYQANLTRMVSIALKAKTPIILSTVPSNLHDMAPLQPSQGKPTVQHLREVEKLMSYGEYKPALASLTEVRQADPTNPLLAYREGQCLEMLDRQEEAAASYSMASDLDGCRLRAASSFLTAVQEVAEAAAGHVYFCDVAAALRSRSQFPVPGNDFFLEHVHYNLAGNWEVASIFGEYIVEDVLGVSWRPERLPDIQTRDELLGVTLLDHVAADSLNLIVFETWPLNLSRVRDRETNILKTRLAENYRALEPTERDLFANLSMSAMQQHLWHAMGNASLATGQAGYALKAFQRHIHRRPWDASGYVGAANALKAQGMSDRAREMLNRARQLNPDVKPLERSIAGPE